MFILSSSVESIFSTIVTSKIAAQCRMFSASSDQVPVSCDRTTRNGGNTRQVLMLRKKRRNTQVPMTCLCSPFRSGCLPPMDSPSGRSGARLRLRPRHQYHDSTSFNSTCSSNFHQAVFRARCQISITTCCSDEDHAIHLRHHSGPRMEIHNYTGEEHAIRLEGSRHDLDPQSTLATTCKNSGALPRFN